MPFISDLSEELKQEAAVTRRFLALVDFSKAEYQIHEGSEKFGRLAIHLAEILYWFENVLSTNELNFAQFKAKEINNTTDLLQYFDSLLAQVMLLLEKTTESDLSQEWTMKLGEEVLFSLNKKEVLRKFCMNHFIHHRAQLGVYFRMLSISVPASYGPSNDDDRISLIKPFYSK